jgi:hypothetical protein
MLSRGGNQPGHRGRAPMNLTVYGALRGTVESGLTPVRLNEDGEIVNENRYGGQAEIGLYGAHAWKRTNLGIDYRGDYRRTTPSTGYDGANQALSFDINHTFNARSAMYFRQTAGSSNRAFGGFAAPSIVDPVLNLVNNELFDTRSYFSQTSAGFSYRTSARMTYTFSGDGFFVKRPDPRLIGVSGFRGGAGFQYRVDGRTTLGLQYQHMAFRYPRVNGGSDMQGPVGLYRKQLTRDFGINVSVGAMRVVSRGTQSVLLSPEVAAILGRPRGITAFERRVWVPQIAAGVGYTRQRSRLTVGYMTGMSPGNGVFQATQMNTAYAGYSFTGIRKLSLGLSGRYSNNTSKSIDIGNMSLFSGGGGATYKLSRLISLSTQMDYRKFGTTSGLRGREGFFLSFGLSFSPSEVPISIW